MNKSVSNVLFGGGGAATRLGDLGLLLARVGTGLGIAIGHGLGKVWRDGEFGPSEGFVSGVEKLNFPAPTAMAWAAAVSEFLGGILVALGLLTRPAALMVAGTMGVAAFMQHARDPLFGRAPSKEMALLYFVPAVLFLCTGAGRYGLDALFRKGRGDSRPASPKDSRH